MNMTIAEMKKDINAIAKCNGFIMRKQNMTINSNQSYKFENRKTGRVLVSNMTITSAYDNAQCCDNWINK